MHGPGWAGGGGPPAGEPGGRTQAPEQNTKQPASARGCPAWPANLGQGRKGMESGGGGSVPTFHSPWPPLYPHASSTNSPLRLNSQGLRGASPWGPHLLQACQPFVVPESWVAGNSSICPLNWTRALLSSEPLRMTRQDQNQKHLE